MDISEGLFHALRGNGVLFVGAGFPFGAKNGRAEPDNHIPNATEFSRRLARNLGISKDYDLPIISQYYVSQRGRQELLTELLNSFSITSVADHHLEVAKVPWRRVYTTNYDNCFEFAALQSGTRWASLTLDGAVTGEAKRCIHINGHISNLTTDSLESQIRLTHSSYSADSFSNSPWAGQFRQDLNNSKSVFFVGYSLADLDIARILFSAPDLIDRTFFVVAPNEDDIFVAALENYGNVLRIGVQGLAQRIRNTEVPHDPAPHEYSWLTRYDPDVAPIEPDDKAGIDLLTMGVVESGHVVWCLGERSPAVFVRRTENAEVTTELARGRRWFLIHADLGNGKTILKHQLSRMLARTGYVVYWDTDLEFARMADIRQLAKETGKVALFIDESPERFDVIDGLLTVNIETAVVFVCVRTTLYELGEARYEANLPADYLPLDVNRLADSDVTGFVQVLNRLGLWGRYAVLSNYDKEDFIKVECDRRIGRLILSVFRESEVGQRITAEADKLVNSKDDVSSLIVLSFLFTRVGQLPRLTVLSEVLNMDVWKLVRSEQFEAAGEFIRFSGGAIQARSSILASYLLKYALQPGLLIWHLEKFVRRLAGVKRDTILHHMFTELQRFPVLESLLETPKKRELLIGYYQALKELPFCQKNALFWLHYAMARMSFGEFREARLYFEHARSLAKGNAKDTIDVNNHFARLLLDSRTNSEDYDDHFEAFREAHNILLEQMVRNTNRHFPFRQAKKYVEFISFRAGRLTGEQKERFCNSCGQVETAIEHLKGSITNSREVKECKEAMARAIAIARAH